MTEPRRKEWLFNYNKLLSLVEDLKWHSRKHIADAVLLDQDDLLKLIQSEIERNLKEFAAYVKLAPNNCHENGVCCNCRFDMETFMDAALKDRGIE